ncbi:MAG: DUF3999 domain-containing protein [Myxococcales bacterium]|nr:DUF3999 domain-containing protein [Myxococcales bacterium]
MNRSAWLSPLFVLLLIGLVSAAAEVPEKLADWPLLAALTTAEGDAALTCAELPPALLDAARADLADLRLVETGDDEKVPYVARENRGERVRIEMPVNIFNQAYQPGVSATATADVGQHIFRDAVVIETAGVAFRRRVSVEGSEDGEQWKMLREQAYLFRVDGTGRFEKSHVALPPNDFRYLRLTVYRDADDPPRLEIERVRILQIDQKADPLVTFEPKLIETVEKPKEKETWLTFDAGANHLHLADLRLDFADDNFWRRVVVYGRSAATRTRKIQREDGAALEKTEETPWENVASDIVYRYRSEKTTAESLNIDLPATPFRYLQVRIINQDDKPLTYRAARLGRIPVKFYFQARPGKSYALYAGNPDAKAPIYDLARLIDELKRGGVGQATIGALEANPTYRAEAGGDQPWSERYAAYLWIVLLAALGILGFLVYRLVRQAGKPGAV